MVTDCRTLLAEAAADMLLCPKVSVFNENGKSNAYPFASFRYPGNPEFSRELNLNLLRESLWYQATCSLKIPVFTT